MRVAFLGLGIMGSRMAANLAEREFELIVWNRTAARAEEFAAAHADVEVAASPQAAAADVEVVVSMVVDGPQVEAILLGSEGAAAGAVPGTLFVDCSTIGATEARRIGAALDERSLTLLDAPVTGSSPRAQDGTLTIMVGGPDEAFERVRPVLEAMGSLIVHAGPLGQGQLVKVINNAVAATNAAVLGEALLMAQGAGADLDPLLRVMAAGSGGSAMLTSRRARCDGTTTPRCSNSTTCSRTCACAWMRPGKPACRSIWRCEARRFWPRPLPRVTAITISPRSSIPSSGRQGSS